MKIRNHTTPYAPSPSPTRDLLADPVAQEQRLIRQAQAGEINSFNQLVLRYQDRVYRQAVWILHEPEAAEDATQEAFLLAYRHFPSFRGGSLRPWLLRIVTNYCLDQLRKIKGHPTQPLELYTEEGEEVEPGWIADPGESPEQAVERAELGEVITRSIQKLAPAFRIAVLLVDLQKLNYAEAAWVMRIPVGTFKSRLARARRKLSEDLRSKNLS